MRRSLKPESITKFLIITPPKTAIRTSRPSTVLPVGRGTGGFFHPGVQVTAGPGLWDRQGTGRAPYKKINYISRRIYGASRCGVEAYVKTREQMGLYKRGYLLLDFIRCFWERWPTHTIICGLLNCDVEMSLYTDIKCGILWTSTEWPYSIFRDINPVVQF